MKPEQIESGVYITPETERIYVAPSEIEYQQGHIIRGRFKKVEYDAIATLFVEDAQKYERWIAVSPHYLAKRFKEFVSSMAGFSDMLVAHLLLAGNLGNKIEKMTKDGYFKEIHLPEGLLLAPTAKLARKLAGKK